MLNNQLARDVIDRAIEVAEISPRTRPITPKLTITFDGTQWDASITGITSVLVVGRVGHGRDAGEALWNLAGELNMRRDYHTGEYQHVPVVAS